MSITPPLPNASRETYHRGRKAILPVAFLALVVARLRPFRVEVRGDSMLPTLEPGDWCLAIRARYLRSGDLVVVEDPRRPGFDLVKRLLEPAHGGWFVRGDNAAASTDSRTFGAVPVRAIKGRVVLVYWPPRRWRWLSPGTSPGLRT